MDNFRGASLMALSMILFALEDAFMKTVTQRVPIGQVLIYMGVGGALGFAFLAIRKGYRAIGPDYLNRAVVVRNLAEIVGTAAFVTTLTTLPLSLASALQQAVPIFVTLGAILFFGERVGWKRWLAISIGLVGVLIIIRPGMEGFRPEALWGVVAGVALAVRDLATRPVPATVHPLQLAGWGFLSLIPAGGILLALSGGAVNPTLPEAGMIAAALVLGMGGYYALTRAMQTGEIGFVTPFRYVRLLAALTIAAIVFSERPDALTLLGAAIVVGAGLYTLLRERALMRQRPKVTLPRA